MAAVKAMKQTIEARPISADFAYTRKNLWLKYLVDRVLAFVLLIALSPVLIAAGFALLIQLVLSQTARGPFLMSEERISQGRPFRMFKFRTCSADDENITPVGYYLRKFYLDELPQLLNILAGHMSVVGPRPVPRFMYENVLERGHQSKRVLRAGLCGPVQALKGRWREYGNYLEADEALIHEYSSRSSVGVLMLDLQIMWQTFHKVLDGDGLDHPYR